MRICKRESPKSGFQRDSPKLESEEVQECEDVGLCGAFRFYSLLRRLCPLRISRLSFPPAAAMPAQGAVVPGLRVHPGFSPGRLCPLRVFWHTAGAGRSAADAQSA